MASSTLPQRPTTSTNGLAERAVQTVKQGLQQMQGGTVEEKLARFLMKYRITPHSTTGISPSELLMGRRLRSRLDILHPDLSGKVEDKQWKQKLAHDNQKAPRTFEEGDPVFAEDFTASSEKWLPGVIQKVTGPLSYRIQLADGRVVRRHVDNMRARSHGKRREPEMELTGNEIFLTQELVTLQQNLTMEWAGNMTFQHWWTLNQSHQTCLWCRM